MKKDGARMEELFKQQMSKDLRNAPKGLWQQRGACKMTLKRRKPIIVAAVFMLCLAVPVFAQWVVFDPTACANLIEQIGQLETQYQQLVQTYNQITSQFNRWSSMPNGSPTRNAS